MTDKKKEAKTRTSITIDPAVLDSLRKHCENAGVSVSSFIEVTVAAALGLGAVSSGETVDG